MALSERKDTVPAKLAFVVESLLKPDAKVSFNATEHPVVLWRVYSDKLTLQKKLIQNTSERILE